MNRRRSAALLVVVAGIIVSLAAGFLVLGVVGVGQALRQVQAAAGDLTASLRDSNLKDLSDQTTLLVRATEKLKDATNSPAWAVISSLPILGDSASAISAVSVEVNKLAVAVVPVTRDLASTDSLVREIALVIDDVQTLEVLSNHTEATIDAMYRLTGQSILRPGVLGLRSIIASLDQVNSGLEAAKSASPYIPTLLGVPNTRTWLVVVGVQEPSQPGTFWPVASTMVTADQGIMSFRPSGHEIDVQLGQLRTQPPSLAAKVIESLELTTPVDGIIVMDQDALGTFLQVNGVRQLAGMTIEDTTVYDWLARGIATSQAITQVLSESWVKATSSTQGMGANLSPMGQTAQDGHVVFWVREPDIQRWLMEAGVTGKS